MTSMLNAMQWLEATRVSVAIRESTLLFPVLEGTHLISVFLAVGTIAALDLRLLGWGMKRTPVSVVFEQLRKFTLGVFAVCFLTGILLFWSEPVKCYQTTSFILKMFFLVGLAINALIFDRRVYPTVVGWDNLLTVPSRARLAGATSLFLWAAVIFCGRWTAYF